jgi:CHASE2 domain-containing sensor protein
MAPWLRRITLALAAIVAIAVTVHLAWELLRPTLPALIALLVVVALVTAFLRRTKGW